MQFDLLAVLGRGIQRVGGQWQPGADFEMWGVVEGYRGHLAEPLPIDDDSANCFIGGCELNLRAGAEIFQQFGAKVVVCAYGDRAPYLRRVNGPTESEIDTGVFLNFSSFSVLYTPTVEIWTKEKSAPAFNTYQELTNIFSLAKARGMFKVAICAITVHLPRVRVFAEKILSTAELGQFVVSYFSAEQVLVEADAIVYAPRVLAIYASKAFARTAASEAKGVQRFLTGKYVM